MRRACEVLLLVLLLSACAAATSGTNDDATISTRVKIALLGDPQLGPERLDAHTFQGVVTVSGTVKSADEERHAMALAKKVRGVRDVKSEMKIAGSPVFSADLVAWKAERDERLRYLSHHGGRSA
jgi:hyperosmotically inducible periplasmic protein